MATPFPFTPGQNLTAAQMNAITTLPINDQTANYTLVVGDVGKRVVMNVASANTVTVNDSIFAAGDTIFIANKGAGVSTITAGAGVTINTSGSLALAQYGGGTLIALSASTFTFFPAAGMGQGTAPGLVFINKTSFSAVTSIAIDNVFSSTYEQYRVVFRATNSTTATTSMVFRASAVDTTTNYTTQFLAVNAGSITSNRFTGGNNFDLGGGQAGPNHIICDMYGPNLAAVTSTLFLENNSYGTGNNFAVHANAQNSSTQFDGLKFSISSGTFTGTVSVFGYQDS